ESICERGADNKVFAVAENAAEPIAVNELARALALDVDTARRHREDAHLFPLLAGDPKPHSRAQEREDGDRPNKRQTRGDAQRAGGVARQGEQPFYERADGERGAEADNCARDAEADDPSSRDRDGCLVLSHAVLLLAACAG